MTAMRIPNVPLLKLQNGNLEMFDADQTETTKINWNTPWKFNIDPELKQAIPKGNSSSNHDFSGARLNFGGVFFDKG